MPACWQWWMFSIASVVATSFTLSGLVELWSYRSWSQVTSLFKNADAKSIFIISPSTPSSTPLLHHFNCFLKYPSPNPVLNYPLGFQKISMDLLYSTFLSSYLPTLPALWSSSPSFLSTPSPQFSTDEGFVFSLVLSFLFAPLGTWQSRGILEDNNSSCNSQDRKWLRPG